MPLLGCDLDIWLSTLQDVLEVLSGNYQNVFIFKLYIYIYWIFFNFVFEHIRFCQSLNLNL